MISGSVCSGIEAASVAWHPLGWRPAFFSEVEKFPRAVLSHHWPGVPLHGDFTTIQAGDYEPIDLLVGGTPCQDFSVAGLRAGIAGERGKLTVEFVHLARRLRPRWLVWENVPGILSIDGGRAFGAFLGILGQCGYGSAYRVLDAQYFGVPQRRRRVFVVGYLGDWRRAAAVLFERESLSGHPPPRREAGKGTAGRVAPCLGEDLGHYLNQQMAENGHLIGPDDLARPLRAQSQPSHRADSDTYIAHSLRADGFDASEDGTGRGTPLTIAFTGGATDILTEEEMAQPITGRNGDPGMISSLCAVRRLTPRECERLQGFRDDYTLVPYRGTPATDGPRYKALGNSMAVPCMRWIGQRIVAVDRMARAA